MQGLQGETNHDILEWQSELKVAEGTMHPQLYGVPFFQNMGHAMRPCNAAILFWISLQRGWRGFAAVQVCSNPLLKKQLLIVGLHFCGDTTNKLGECGRWV